MKKKCKTKPKYKDGGQLLNMLPSLLSAIPGIGSIAAPIVGGIIQQEQQKNNELQMLNDHFNSVKTGTNPYGYMKNGGELQGSYTVPEFNGANHSNGGIDVSNMGIPTEENSIAEVEDGETKFTIGGKTFIFSKSLTLKSDIKSKKNEK